MDKKLYNIPYLEEQDINEDGSLKSHVTKKKPTLVMVQGNFCGYCTQAKPDFQKLANNPYFSVATVMIDGSESEKRASSKLPKTQGVPAYIGFTSDGKNGIIHNGNRDAQSLIDFMKSFK